MELNIIAPNIAGGGDTMREVRAAAGNLGDLIISSGENGLLQNMVNAGLLYNMEDALKDKETVYGNKLESKYKLWLGVPKKIFNNYAYDNDYKTTADELIREGRYGTTVFYDKDRNFKRWLLMKYMFHNYFKRYKTYYEVNKGKIFDEENKKLNK